MLRSQHIESITQEKKTGQPFFAKPQEMFSNSAASLQRPQFLTSSNDTEKFGVWLANFKYCSARSRRLYGERNQSFTCMSDPFVGLDTIMAGLNFFVLDHEHFLCPVEIFVVPDLPM